MLVEEGIFEEFCEYKFPFDTLTKVGRPHYDIPHKDRHVSEVIL